MHLIYVISKLKSHMLNACKLWVDWLYLWSIESNPFIDRQGREERLSCLEVHGKGKIESIFFCFKAQSWLKLMLGRKEKLTHKAFLATNSTLNHALSHNTCNINSYQSRTHVFHAGYHKDDRLATIWMQLGFLSFLVCSQHHWERTACKCYFYSSITSESR